MTGPVLEVRGLTKMYGSFVALDDLNLEIQAGEVFGLLGPNGSGKTTTLGMLLDVISPTSGSFQWFGGDRQDPRRSIGAILEKPNFYPTFSAWANLEIAASIKRCSHDRIPYVLEIVGLSSRQNDTFRTYSLGMKQRLSIASALLNDPDVLILDEPTNGLDPEGIAEIRAIVNEIAQQGKTIILASHLLDEVQKVCQTFGVLRHGRLIHRGKVREDLRSEKVVELDHPDRELLLRLVPLIPGYKGCEYQDHALVARFDPEIEWSQISNYLGESSCHPTLFSPRFKSLEEQFLDILSADD